MIRRLSDWLTASWYRQSFLSVLLWPLGLLFEVAVNLRRQCYRWGLLEQYRAALPVIVVGNISVGGTGKTPLIIWLAQFLIQHGYRPGIISRGYGGQSKHWPLWVDINGDPKRVGDEALLIAARTGCPMIVAPRRADAARLLIESKCCDIILSDDGLQHYALARDIEIAVIDGSRRFGNGQCLPAGPLREPVSRLAEVDLIIVNGGVARENEYCMHLEGDVAVNTVDGAHMKLRELSGKTCHAVAGIGNPGRFFRKLEDLGLICQRHAFPDHHRYRREDLDFPDRLPVLMTEKDAVKCKFFGDKRHWSVPVGAIPEPEFSNRIINLLREKHAGHKIN